jgi:hypothetical protein
MRCVSTMTSWNGSDAEGSVWCDVEVVYKERDWSL